MVAPKKGKTKAGKKAKSWYHVVSPSLFGAKELGETPSSDTKSLINRVISVPLSSLTGNFRQFKTSIKLRVMKLEGKKALTEYDGQTLTDDEVSRKVHRWSSRIDSIDDIKTKDGKSMRVKTLIVTTRRVNTSIKDEMRSAISTHVRKFAKEREMEKFVNDVSANILQKNARTPLAKIHPVKSVDVRKIEVMG